MKKTAALFLAIILLLSVTLTSCSIGDMFSNLSEKFEDLELFGDDDSKESIDFIFTSTDNGNAKISGVFLNNIKEEKTLVFPDKSPDGEDIVEIDGTVYGYGGLPKMLLPEDLYSIRDTMNDTVSELYSNDGEILHKTRVFLSYYMIFNLEDAADEKEKAILLDKYPILAVTPVCVLDIENMNSLTVLDLLNTLYLYGEHTATNGKGYYDALLDKAKEANISADDIPLPIATGENIISVELPSNIKTISGFASYTSLTDITIPKGVTTIEDYSFGQCAKLSSITIPENVISIGASAFYGCDSLESITISNGVTSIGNSAFANCRSLERINVDSGNAKYYSKDNCLIDTSTQTLILGCKNSILPNGIRSIGNAAFIGCTELTSITIPDSVESIGESACSYCVGLTSITIPDSIKSMGKSAFSYCARLAEINFNATEMLSASDRMFYNAGQDINGIKLNIGENVTKIPAYLFEGNNYITSIIFAENSQCKSIGYSSFKDCVGLKTITIPDSITDIEDSAFEGCTALTEIDFNATAMNDLKNDNSVFKNAGQSDVGITVNIGENVTKLPALLFVSCKNLSIVNFNATAMDDLSPNSHALANTVTVNIGANVTKIPAYLFDGNSHITNVVFFEKSQCESIGGYAFRNCTSLKNITMSDRVKSIGNNAFYGCQSLMTIGIPESVDSIGVGVFGDCAILMGITLEDTSTWYVTTSSTDWKNKVGGTKVDPLTNSGTDVIAAIFRSYSSYYYWYKL